MGCIQILPPQEARRIAAGEVIDRPASLVREFIDNAIDSGAANIDLCIEEGGCKKVEVADDGSGISHDDLLLCSLAHATSKIRCLDDLNRAETLGFRGEALAAAAAVAQLEIVSGTADGDAWRLTAGPGDGGTAHPPYTERASRTRGSTVRALNLYDTIPARKHFLKREGSEAIQCRQIFIEKALTFPEINFRFTQDGRPKIILPAAPSKKARFAAALVSTGFLNSGEEQFLHEIHVSGDGFSADVVIGGPEIFRGDRRMLHVFANGRRIQDYSLMTALEYGAQGLFPNGTRPVGALYIDIDPALADFNIHPAKREVRFRDSGAIHHAVSTGLRSFFHNYSLKASQGDASGLRSAVQGTQKRFGDSDLGQELVKEALSDNKEFTHYVPFSAPRIEGSTRLREIFSGINSSVAETAPIYGEPQFVGRAFGVFILAEWGEKLFIIDQHAAHERILYNRFMAAPIPRQELLIPIAFNTESAQDNNFLEAKQEELARLAIVIERDGSGWRIDALPEGWRLSDGETVREILALREAKENIAERWAATVCCHQALKDGDYIDDEAALALIKETLALPEPCCPHGRPVWTELTREALYRAVRRTGF